MPCVQLIHFALPFRQSNFISNRKAKNVQALEVFSSDILRYYAVLIWSRQNSVTATGRAVPPRLLHFSLSCESWVSSTTWQESSALSYSDNVRDLGSGSVWVCRCVSKHPSQFKALSLSPGFGHHRDGLARQKNVQCCDCGPCGSPPVGSLSLLLGHLTPSSPHSPSTSP